MPKKQDRISQFLRLSKKEFEEYVKTNDINRLAQAGEKLWNAFSMLVEMIVGRKISRFKELKDAVFDIYKERLDRTVLIAFENAYSLHRFFYKGWTEDIGIEEEQYKLVYDLIELLRKRYKV
jgi:hypothetical protein